MQLSAKQREAFKVGVPLAVVSVLIVLAVLSRFWLVEWPNFKPVAAVAIFAGFLLGSRWWVWLVPLSILLLSDAFIGFYQWPIMVSVYGSMFLAVGVGMLLARKFRSQGGRPWTCLAGITAGSMAVSLLFFLSTNASVVVAGWYPFTWAGLMQSYQAGLPFLRFALIGDLLFTAGLFGAHFAILAVVSKRRASKRRAAIASYVPLRGTAAAASRSVST